jgi:hypothetical protein
MIDIEDKALVCGFMNMDGRSALALPIQQNNA